MTFKHMKALSLKQPFADLLVEGIKTIELRKWNTKFRGTFLVHASKIPFAGQLNFFNVLFDEQNRLAKQFIVQEKLF